MKNQSCSTISFIQIIQGKERLKKESKKEKKKEKKY